MSSRWILMFKEIKSWQDPELFTWVEVEVREKQIVLHLAHEEIVLEPINADQLDLEEPISGCKLRGRSSFYCFTNLEDAVEFLAERRMRWGISLERMHRELQRAL